MTETREMTKTEPRAVETQREPLFMPYVDIYETTNELILLADMPGVGEGDIDIDLEKGVLALRGRVKPQDMSGFKPLLGEYRAGDYYRAFTLSNEIDETRITATIKDGVLRVVLPKVEHVKAKKIAVTTG
ncbi:MAG TPA: Hsp20/alpha crystallin family protein [Candidatus Brocadiia bacterium]|nr:Hsp20/alpha crystallin family protein [Candidatus Brocadiia bacterium]